MFDFNPNDNDLYIDVCGIAFYNCGVCAGIRDDLRLLLSLGDEVESAVKQILDYYLPNIKTRVSDYEYAYYEPLTHIAIAYYLAYSGYYHEATFKRAVEAIDSEETLFPFKDAIEYKKQGVDAFGEELLDCFGNSAAQAVGLMAGIEVPEGATLDIRRSSAPKIIKQILFLDGKPEKNYLKRKEVLLKVKELIVNKNKPLKKPTPSSVIYGFSDYRFYSDFEEGDVVAYKIKSGIYAGKYAILVVDYLREIRWLRCDYKRFVSTSEEFALVSKLYDKIPTLPIHFIYQPIEKAKENNFIMLLECHGNKKIYKSFDFIKIGSTDAPKFERYYFDKRAFGIKEKDACVSFSSTESLDEIITEAFNSIKADGGEI